MDPISIAAAAAGISASCFKIARLLHAYVEEVKEVDNVIALFGKDLRTLSRALDSVHDALSDHGKELAASLGRDVKLFDSLEGCIQDCGETVERIDEILTKAQTHGPVGQSMRRVATHLKLSDKAQELALLRGRVISFHTAMNMSLQMIHVCLALHIQASSESKQEDVLDGIGQLQRQIKRLTRLAQKQRPDDDESCTLPGSVQKCLDSAVALDTSASTAVDDMQSVLGAMTQAPEEKIARWMTDSEKWEVPASNPNMGDAESFDDESASMFRGTAPTTQVTDLDLELSDHQTKLQTARDLSSRGRIESAKSLCREVIHDSEFAAGVNDPSYKEGVLLLAELYEHAGDVDEANSLREILDPERRVKVRNDFKALLQKQSLSACVEFVLVWACLLYDNDPLNRYRELLQKLPLHDNFSDSVVSAVVAAAGNSFLVQLMLSRGTSFTRPIPLGEGEGEETTAFECAFNFGHRHVVQLLLESTPNRTGAADLDSKYIVQAIAAHDSQMVALLLEYGADANTIYTSPDSERTILWKAVDISDIKMAELLLEKGASPDFRLPDGSPQRVLVKAVHRKNLPMTNLLLEHGAQRVYYKYGWGQENDEWEKNTLSLDRDGPVVFAIAKDWKGLVEVLVTEESHVFRRAIRETIDHRRQPLLEYLLSKNPIFAAVGVDYAVTMGAVWSLEPLFRVGGQVIYSHLSNAVQQAIPPKPEMVKALLEAGAPVTGPDDDNGPEDTNRLLRYAIKMALDPDTLPYNIPPLMKTISLLSKAGAKCSPAKMRRLTLSSRRRGVLALLKGADFKS